MCLHLDSKQLTIFHTEGRAKLSLLPNLWFIGSKLRGLYLLFALDIWNFKLTFSLHWKIFCCSLSCFGKETFICKETDFQNKLWNSVSLTTAIFFRTVLTLCINANTWCVITSEAKSLSEPVATIIYIFNIVARIPWCPLRPTMLIISGRKIPDIFSLYLLNTKCSYFFPKWKPTRKTERCRSLLKQPLHYSGVQELL